MDGLAGARAPLLVLASTAFRFSMARWHPRQEHGSPWPRLGEKASIEPTKAALQVLNSAVGRGQVQTDAISASTSTRSFVGLPNPDGGIALSLATASPVAQCCDSTDACADTGTKHHASSDDSGRESTGLAGRNRHSGGATAALPGRLVQGLEELWHYRSPR